MVTDFPNLRTLIEWIKSLRIKPTLKLLMRSLADYHGNDGKCFPAIKRLAHECTVCRQTIQRWLNELEQLGLIARSAQYRPDGGGQTSNLYRFCLPVLQGGVATVATPIKAIKKIIHADKQDVSSMKSDDGASVRPVVEATDQQSSPSNTTARNQAARTPKKPYRIEAASMQKPEEADRQYRAYVNQKWIGPGDRDRVSFFGCWAKVVRMWRDGKASEPGALLGAMIKKGLLHKYPTEEDESRGLEVLRRLRIDEDKATRGRLVAA